MYTTQTEAIDKSYITGTALQYLTESQLCQMLQHNQMDRQRVVLRPQIATSTAGTRSLTTASQHRMLSIDIMQILCRNIVQQQAILE